MQLKEYTAAEAVYHKAQIENKEGFDDDSRLKVRVQELLSELDIVTSVSVEREVGMDEIAVLEGILMSL
ncbi:unnamed protein product [Brassica napus]|uniref:(rape) hypothetical protein n=1 Tax=Brassica napus TaxID=3708 RepID=A0A816K958_BRANA|nr:unnamed protein product [Brassica napus]